MTRLFYSKKASQAEFEERVTRVIGNKVELVKREMEFEMEKRSNALQLQITHLEDENRKLQSEIDKLSHEIQHKNFQIGALLLGFSAYMGYLNYNRF